MLDPCSSPQQLSHSAHASHDRARFMAGLNGRASRACSGGLPVWADAAGAGEARLLAHRAPQRLADRRA
jgi:hypothetical protein